mmetsp:Transcript_43436/g.100520  ORF Transcript_43436/g.100520 Transcript_43436/m.100520 type:complete len:460 (+) Transcript_43436:29-1408(+)
MRCACELEEKDAGSVASSHGVVAVSFDMLGAYSAHSSVLLGPDDSAAAVLDCHISVERSTLVRQRLMDVLASSDAAGPCLHFTVFVGSGDDAEPLLVGAAMLPLCELIARAEQGSSRWELPVLTLAPAGSVASGAKPLSAAGRLTVTIDGHGELLQIAEAVRKHGGAHRAEAAEAREAKAGQNSGSAEPRSVRIQVTDLLLAGESESWHDAREKSPSPPGLFDCCLHRRSNALLILFLSTLDIWTDVALGCMWLTGGHVLWGVMLLLFLALSLLVTLVVTLIPTPNGYVIPPVAFPATALCIGPPLAAARAAFGSSGDGEGALDLAQDMHLTEALVAGCPSLVLQLYALLSLGPSNASTLLWLAMCSSLLSVSYAVGSDFEFEQGLGALNRLVSAEFALALGRVGSASLPLALCANAFGHWALLPPLAGVLGAVTISMIHRTIVGPRRDIRPPREHRIR